MRYASRKRSSAFHSVGEEPGGIGSFTTSAPVSPAATSLPSRSSTRRSQPGTARVGDPGFTGSRSMPEAVRGDRPARLGLPPVVDHRHAELLLGPAQRLRIAALAREEERPESREVVVGDQLAVGILLPDRAERRRRGEERRRRRAARSRARRRPRRECRRASPRRAPSCTRAGAARRRCTSGRRPSRRRTPPSTPRPARRRRRSSSTTRARPRGRRCRARFPSAGRSCPTCRGCRAGRSPRRRRSPRARRRAIASFQSTSRPGTSSRFELRPLEDDAALGLHRRLLDRRVEQRLVRDRARRLDPARRGHDHLRLRVLDPARELVRGEAAEDDRVHGADPRAGEHRDRRPPGPSACRRSPGRRARRPARRARRRSARRRRGARGT